jgi:hypothetical protein
MSNWNTRLVDCNVRMGSGLSYSIVPLSYWQSRPIAVSLGNYSVTVLFEDGYHWGGGMTRSKITLCDAIVKYLI